MNITQEQNGIDPHRVPPGMQRDIEIQKNLDRLTKNVRMFRALTWLMIFIAASAFVSIFFLLP